MNSLFLRDLCAALVLSFGHFLWIGTLIAVMAAVAVRRQRTAEARYRVWLAALVAMAVSPFVTLAILMSMPSAVTSVDAVPASAPTALVAEPVDATALGDAAEDARRMGTPARPLPDDERPHAGNEDGRAGVPILQGDRAANALTELPPIVTDASLREPAWWHEYAPIVTSLYLIGVALMGLRLAFGLWGGRRLRNQATLITERSLLDALQRQADALGMTLVPALAYCERVAVPTVLGILKPMILLPVSLASGLAPDQIESVLAHELAHLRRYDHLVNLMQCVIESVLFFHSAVWWVSRRVRDEREHCCDDLVIACGAVPLDYAASLLRVAELSRETERQRGHNHQKSFTAVSLFATGDRPSTLRQRITRLLGYQTELNVRAVSPWVLFCLATCCVGAIWLLSSMTFVVLAEINRDRSQKTVIVTWSAIVDDSVMNEIRAINGLATIGTGAMQTPDDAKFSTLRCSAEELRAILKNHADNKRLVALQKTIRHSMPTGGWRIGGEKRFFQMIDSETIETTVVHDPGYSLNWYADGNETRDEDSDRARLIVDGKFHFTQMGHFSALAAKDVETADGVPKLQYGNAESKTTAKFDSVMSDGDATLVVLSPPAVTRQYQELVMDDKGQRFEAKTKQAPQLHAIFVHEAVRVPVKQLDQFHKLTRVEDWVRRGANETRDHVARIAEWQSRPSRSVFDADAAWTHELPNGGHVQLVGLGRPNEAQMIWWTPTGEPLLNVSDQATQSLTSYELAAIVRVWETGASRVQPRPIGVRSVGDVVEVADKFPSPGSQLLIVPAVFDKTTGKTSLKIGAGFGAWTSETKIGSAMDSTATLNGIEIKTQHAHEHTTHHPASMGKYPPKLVMQTSTAFRWEPTPDFEFTAQAVTVKGQVIDTIWKPMVYANEPPNTKNGAAFFDHIAPQADIQHFLIKSRPVHWTEFTDFATEPKVALVPPFEFDRLAKAEAAKKADPMQFRDHYIAELPDGRSVEFVGITKNTAPANEGWKPDGRAIGDVGYWPSTMVLHSKEKRSFSSSTYVENGPHPEPDAEAIDVLFRFQGLKEQPSIAFDMATNGASYSHLPLKQPYDLRGSTRRRGDPHPGSQWSIPDGKFRVGLTDEPWGKWLQVSPSGEVLNPPIAGDLYESSYEQVRLERVEPHERAPNKLALVLRQPMNLSSLYAFEIRGIDEDGKSQWVLEWEGRGVEGSELKEGRWGLASSEMKPLARYEFRLRPYRHWVTFTGVSLEPGKESDVKVKVEVVKRNEADDALLAKHAEELKRTVVGTVVSPQGKPVAGIEVLAFQGEKQLEQKFVTDERGQVRVPKEWRETEHWLTLVARNGRERLGWFDFMIHGHSDIGQNAEDGSFKLVLLPMSRTVRGRVVDDAGMPLPQVSVRINQLSHDVNQMAVHWRYQTLGDEPLVRGGVTDNEGRFEVKVPADSTVWLGTKHPDWVEQTIIFRKDNDDAGETKLVRAAKVAGRVTDARNGKPLAGVVIAAQATETEIGQSSGDEAKTDADGNYVITGLRAGTYTIQLKRSLFKTMTAAAHTGVELKAGESHPADFALNVGQRLTGRVLHIDTGKPIANCKVNCTNPAHPNGDLSTETDEQGEFEFFVPTGRSILDATEGRRFGNDSTREVDVPTEGEVAPITLRVGEQIERVPGSFRISIGPPLERKVRLDFKDEPFAEALKLLCDSAIVTLELDEASLTSAGYSKETPVTLTDENPVTLQDALTRFLKPFDKLAFSFDTNKVFVSTREQVEVRKKQVAEPKPPNDDKNSGATSLPKGLEFLKPYPKLHGLSLDMTETQFLEIVKQHELKTKKTGEGDKTAYHMGLGDGLTLIVMFHKDATCRGIQRIRGEDAVDETISLAEAVRNFNAENKRLGRGLDQPALTEDEVIAVIKRDKWQRGDPWSLNEKEIAAFKAVAESQRLLKGSRLDVHTEDRAETFLLKQVWQVRLMLPAIGHDGLVGLTIRDTKIADERIDPKQVAWGKPDADGLALGAYLSPRKAQYTLGERVRLRLFVRNDGKKALNGLTFMNTSHPMPDDFTVTDDNGAKVGVRIGHEDWDHPWVSGAIVGGLAPGEAHAFFVPYEILIGGDGSQNELIGRVIDARPGQKLQLKVREHNGSDRERQQGEPEPESGSISFTVAEDPLAPTARLPNSEDATKTTSDAKGRQRSDNAAGSGVPRRAQGELRTLLKPAVLLPDHWIVQAVGFDDDGKELATASNQSFITIRRWDVVGMKLISEIKLQADKHGRAVHDGTLMFSGDRRRVIAATDAYVGIWETATGKLLTKLPIPKIEMNDTVRILSCTPDFSVIVGSLETNYDRTTLIYDAHTVVWDANSGKQLRINTHKHQNDLITLSLSSDGKRFATTNGGGANIWDTSTGQRLLEVPNDNKGRARSDSDVTGIDSNHVWSIQISPDGKQLAMGDTLGVKLIDATSGKLLQHLEGPFSFSSGRSPNVVFSKDGQWLARLGTGDKVDGRSTGYVMPIWSTKTGQKLFELHTNANDAAFSDDGQRLAVVYSDMQQALSVWHLPVAEVVRLPNTPQDGTLTSSATVEQTAGPGPHSRQDRVEENGHYVGKTAAEFIDKFQPTWGDTQLGLQYGIALTKPQRKFASGERVPLVAFFRNASDKPIKFNTAPDFFGNAPRVLNSQGEQLTLDNIPLLGSIPHYHETLAPGEALGPFYMSIGLGENPRPNQQHWHPLLKTPVVGQHKLTHTVSINLPETKAGEPVSKAELTSGTVEFEVVATPTAATVTLPVSAPSAKPRGEGPTEAPTNNLANAEKEPNELETALPTTRISAGTGGSFLSHAE